MGRDIRNSVKMLWRNLSETFRELSTAFGQDPGTIMAYWYMDSGQGGRFGSRLKIFRSSSLLISCRNIWTFAYTASGAGDGRV
jgi:hypothetical protein